MRLTAAQELFDPLELEQGLHLLDVLTWFPDAGEDRWEKAAEYVATNAAVGSPPSPDACRQVLERVLSTASGALEDAGERGRWRNIPRAKWLYQVKYDLMRLLYPDDWFRFMNMGYAERGYFLDDSLPPAQRIWQFAANLYRRVAGQVSLAGADVLEVGCGRGGGADLVATTMAPRSLVGLDYSANNVEFCQTVYRHSCLRFQQGDAERLPFDDNTFDAVINVESAHCYPRVEQFFVEVGRVLKPGGHLLFADEWWSWQIDALGEYLGAAGLEVVDQQDITPGVIRALRLLETKADELLRDLPDGPRRDAYQRFFHQRVCQQSAYSYTSGRFVFLQVLARALDAGC